MKSRCGIVGETGLQFYGKMCASMSHEIKNALAVIQEHAGLLDDFAAMAGQGMPINPDRVKSLAEKIQGQISRANGIIKGLNRLAHSVDEFEKKVDLGDALAYLVTLTQRLASRRGVRVEVRTPDAPIAIETSPLFLQNLLWLCLDFAMDASGEKKSVAVSLQENQSGVQVVFTGLDKSDDITLPPFPSNSAEALIDTLGARLEKRIETKELILTLPRDLRR